MRLRGQGSSPTQHQSDLATHQLPDAAEDEGVHDGRGVAPPRPGLLVALTVVKQRLEEGPLLAHVLLDALEDPAINESSVFININQSEVSIFS